MTGPIKFDFSSYTAAIPAILAIREQETGPIIAESQESQSIDAKNAEFPDNSATTQNRRIAGIAAVYEDFQDDRRHCSECKNLRNGYCIKQRFRPVDDIPRRCEDFTCYPNQIGQQLDSEAKPESATDPLLVEVWTPSGTAMTIRADSLDHTEWLRIMNPKPANSTPDQTIPEPDTDLISEAEHNAQGRFFKFLVTMPDGTQFYSCSMPHMTMKEIKIQYHDAAAIEPVTGEDYQND